MTLTGNLKLQIILTSESAPSSRVRCSNFLPLLAKHGIAAKKDVYPGSWRQRLALYRRCREADLVLLQKKLLSPLQLWLLKLNSRAMVYDFDDAIHIRQNNGVAEKSAGRHRKFIYTIRNADHVIAGNGVLASLAKPYNSNITVLPSAVPTTGIPTKNYPCPPKDCTIIGWVGTSYNLPYLALLQPALERLSNEHNVELRVICNMGIEMPGVKVTIIPWSLESQEREIAQFDIGVMPLPDSEHAAGKCGYKALQYMAAAVPAVASDVGINNEIITHNVDGLLAQQINDFYPILKHLIEHPEERQRIGMAGRIRVEKDYSIEVVGKQLADVLKGL